MRISCRGVDYRDPLISTCAGLDLKNFTPYLRKDAMKGGRLGVIRDLKGTDPEVDRVFNESLEELKDLGAVLDDDLDWPAVAQQLRSVVSDPIRAEVKDNYKDYLATLPPGFPRTITELALKGMEFTAPQGEYRPNPSVFPRFKALGERPPLTALSYTSARNFGMPIVEGQVLGLMESNRVEALVYPTRPKQPDLIDPNMPNIVDRVKRRPSPASPTGRSFPT